MSDGSPAAAKSPCARIVLAVFGLLFLIALLSVPVTTSEVGFRQDKGSLLIFRSTYPKNSTMFLPAYLAAKAHAKGGEIRLRSAQWFGTMAIVLILGVFDNLVLCRIWQRSRRRKDGNDEGTSENARGPGLSLFP